MEMKELNLNEMENVTGGDGGYRKKPTEKKGYVIYQVKPGENLTRIAKNFNTTIKAIMAANANVISDKNFICAGYYIYIPQ